MLEKQEFSDLAKIIFDDLKDLGSICPLALSDDEAAMRALLEQLHCMMVSQNFCPGISA